MSWNYRVMKRTKRNPLHAKDPNIPARQEWVEIVECYYDRNGKPHGYADADLDRAASITELRQQLTKALADTYRAPLKASECRAGQGFPVPCGR